VRRAALIAAATAVLPLATACTDDPPAPEPDRESVALELSLGPGASGLSPTERDRLQTAVGDTLSAYVVGAFLGDYPRDDFVVALDSFTSGAARMAAEDLDVVTGDGFGAADDVVATRLDARLSTFAPDDTAAGVTAAVHFEFDVVASDGSIERERLVGRLMLTPEGDEWKIFGYDVDPEGAVGDVP
jgi:hypothetical protein